MASTPPTSKVTLKTVRVTLTTTKVEHMTANVVTKADFVILGRSMTGRAEALLITTAPLTMLSTTQTLPQKSSDLKGSLN